VPLREVQLAGEDAQEPHPQGAVTLSHGRQRLLQQADAGLLARPRVEVVGVADDLERRIALEPLLDEPRVGVFGERDEDPNPVDHLSLPSRCRR